MGISNAAGVNTMRFLAADAVNKVNRGHPGAPMGQASIGYVLWAWSIIHNTEITRCINRGRFVLSPGHENMQA